MELFDAIFSRRSTKLLSEPAPSREEVDRILKAAVQGPDHLQLRPWRFVVLAGQAKEDFSRLSVERLVQREPDATRGKIEKESSKLARAPMVIVVGTKRLEAKIPFEELYAATCAAIENLLLAATALGYGSMWRTGPSVHDEWTKQTLGFDKEDSIVGFIYLGSVQGNAAPVRSVESTEKTTWWQPPPA